MIQIKIFRCAAICLLSTSNLSYAWDFSFSIGRTGQTQDTFRIAALKYWESRWFESSIGHFSGFWDFGFTHWNPGSYHNKNNSLSVSPVFTYEFSTKSSIKPFIEAGIGIAAFSKTHVGSKRLGGSLNFEDRLGVGFSHGNHRFGIRVTHYSNAGIRKPNQGIESYSIYYAHRF